MKDVKELAKQYALEIGLPLFGVASTDPLLNLETLLNARREAGLESHFERNWDAETRCSPQLVFPDVRSIICVGMPYFKPSDSDSPENGHWHVARFAAQTDYHVVMREKLEKLAAFIGKKVGTGFRYYACVDSVPLIERALAHRAGLGWYGKNNMLINPDYGSWFVLGELLVNIYLDPDTPLDDDCGDCDLCLRVCPSGALVGPYTLDARKCISCLTQTLKPVQAELRGKFGRGIFGCDICQEVCPRNRNILHLDKETISSQLFSGEQMEELLEISETEFKEKYGTLGFGWAGKDLLQRNAVVALGCTGQEKYVPSLEKALLGLSPQVRRHAAWALGNVGGRSAMQALVRALKTESDGEVRKEICQALSKNLGQE